MPKEQASPSIQDAEEALESILDDLGSTVLRSMYANDANKARALRFLTPPGFRAVVELMPDGRKTRGTVSADGWNPQDGEIRVHFERIKESTAGQIDAPSASLAASDRRLTELLRALEEAENTPGHSFVALKWFRDEVLPARGYTWTIDADERHAMISAAILEGWIVTNKVANPGNPLHPTTGVRVNRQKKPETDGPPVSRFRPVRILGDPLSSTILRDRGER